MTTATIARATVCNAMTIALTGKGKAARTNAFLQIAPLSFVEALSRTESIANLRIALGTAPSERDLATAKLEWTIGRIASRLPATELPKSMADSSAKLVYARELVETKAAPPKEGAKANKLRKGQTGRRTVGQQRVVRAADEAWSQVKAELGLGTAQTQKARNDAKATAKRATRADPVRGADKGKAPSHSELVASTKAATADDAEAHIMAQLTSLAAYCKRNAKLVRAGMAAVVNTALANATKEAALRASVAAAS